MAKDCVYGGTFREPGFQPFRCFCNFCFGVFHNVLIYFCDPLPSLILSGVAGRIERHDRMMEKDCKRKFQDSPKIFSPRFSPLSPYCLLHQNDSLPILVRRFSRFPPKIPPFPISGNMSSFSVTTENRVIMPATKYDWEAIETHFQTTGRDFAATSKAMGVPKNTLIVRSRRHNWMTPGNARRKIEEGRKELKELVPHVVTMDTVDAVNKTREEQKEKFLGGMSIGLAKAGEYIGTMSPDQILAASRDISNVASSAKLIFNIGADSNAPSLTLNLLNMTADQLVGVSR